MLSQLLEGLLRNKLGGYDRGRSRGYRQDHYRDYREPGPADGGLPDPAAWAEKIRLLPHLKTILICAAAGLLLLLALTAAIIIPLALKLLGLLQQHGLKGLFESVLPFLNLLWQGSGLG